MLYRIVFRTSARKEIRSLPTRDQARVISPIAALAEDPRPRGARKLSGHSQYWRLRVGDYRIVYEIADEVLLVYVVRVAHRRDAYRGL